MVSQGSKATKELLVLLVPNDTTNIFGSDPFINENLYTTGPLAPTGVTGNSAFATPSNAGSFGLGANFVSGGFYGTITSSSGALKVGNYLNIGLSNFH